MLTKVEIFGARSSHLALNIGSLSDTIQVINIDGLGPTKADISSTPYGVIAGETLNGASIGKRNPVFTLGLNPDWGDATIEELRKILYTYFMPACPVTLRFTSTHLPPCEISGVVESCEPMIFAKDPQIQVSVLCGRPYFTAVDPTVITGTVTDSTPFVSFDYEGSVSTGLTMTVESSVARGAYTGPMNFVLNADDVYFSILGLNNVTIDPTYYVELGSIPGSKYVRNVAIGSGTVKTNLLPSAISPIQWPVLYPGPNKLAVQASLPGQDWEMSYYAMFGGL